MPNNGLIFAYHFQSSYELIYFYFRKKLDIENVFNYILF